MQNRFATAIKICVLSCLIVVLVGCSVEPQQSPPPPSNERAEATPLPQTTASEFPPLNEQDLLRLDQRFPTRQRGVLQNAKHIDVYEVDVTFTKGCPREQELLPIEKNKFQGCRVSRHARVSDPEQRKELIDAILYSIGSSGNGNACWGPRHGIRAVHNEERIELLICFECENFRGAPEAPFRSAGDEVGPPSEKFSGGFSPVSAPLFEKILSKTSSKRR
jgi:hypothetical protein